jgi:hypothetical protein
MMKRTIIFSLAILCITTTALAYDSTYLAPIKANGDIDQVVELPVGDSTLTVRGTNDRELSCSVIDQSTKNYASPVLERVPLCLFNSQGLTRPNKIIVKVHNHSDEELTLYFQVKSK